MKNLIESCECIDFEKTADYNYGANVTWPFMTEIPNVRENTGFFKASCRHEGPCGKAVQSIYNLKEVH